MNCDAITYPKLPIVFTKRCFAENRRNTTIMKKLLAGQHGFSLIELIVVLALMGILGLMAGFGISQLADGFIFTKNVSDNVGKGQLAMLRLSEEMRKIKEVNSGSLHSINFVVTHGDGVTKNYTVSWDGTNGHNLLMSDGSNNDVLVDDVKSFTLQYYPAYDGVASPSWGTATKLIEISLTLADSSQIDSVFTTRIAPRNI